jgi:UrcA family protein
MTRTIATLLAACSLAAAGSAFAEAPSARIQHGDLDLNTRAGAQTFAARVHRTARDLCDANPAAERASCVRAVRAEAVQQLPNQGRVRYAINRL